MSARIDHLVVGAATLEEGVAWCEATLGVTPAPGGEHPLMGTHNRLVRVDSSAHPRCYFEVIAVQPGRVPQRARRWFDLDAEAVRDSLRRDGPRLLHFVASVPHVQSAVDALQAQGIDRGEVVRASRETPRGLLQWQITLRPDGGRLFDGVLPTLIEWGDTHPCGGLPDCGVTLQSLHASHPDAQCLQSAFEAIGLQAVSLDCGPANLCATLQTPRGLVELRSGGS